MDAFEQSKNWTYSLHGLIVWKDSELGRPY